MPLGPGGAVAFAPLSPSDCLFNPDFNPAASPSCSPSKHAYISPSKGALKGVPAFVTSAARPVTTHHQLGSLRMVERLSPPRNVRRLLRLAPCAHAAPRPYRARAIPATSPPGLAARAPTHTGHGVARGAQRGLLPELAQRGGRRRLKASRRPPRMHFFYFDDAWSYVDELSSTRSSCMRMSGNTLSMTLNVGFEGAALVSLVAFFFGRRSDSVCVKKNGGEN